MTFNYLSLFSGIGGLDLGLDRAGMTCVGQVELDDLNRSVLDRHWPEVPKHDDVRTAPAWWATRPRPTVRLVAGGFPCQRAGRPAYLVGSTDATSEEPPDQRVCHFQRTGPGHVERRPAARDLRLWPEYRPLHRDN